MKAALCAIALTGCFGNTSTTDLGGDRTPTAPDDVPTGDQQSDSGSEPDGLVEPGLMDPEGAESDEVTFPESSVDVTDDLPNDGRCDGVREWQPIWSQWEDEVVFWTNEARAVGRACGNLGSFEPAPPVTMEKRLRCAARLHSNYMASVGDDFNHETREGVDPFERIEAMDYVYANAGENIAVGQQSPEAVVQGWVDSPGHCRNLMDPIFTEIGVGYAFGIWETQGFYGGVEMAPYWTQKFAAPL